MNGGVSSRISSSSLARQSSMWGDLTPSTTGCPQAEQNPIHITCKVFSSTKGAQAADQLILHVRRLRLDAGYTEQVLRSPGRGPSPYCWLPAACPPALRCPSCPCKVVPPRPRCLQFVVNGGEVEARSRRLLAGLFCSVAVLQIDYLGSSAGLIVREETPVLV